MNMDRWKGKVALVTGASSGIGKATVKKLLESGMKVVGCGRRDEALAEVRTEFASLGELTLIKCDVTQQDDVTTMLSLIKEQHGGVDVCINNAGVVLSAPLLTGSSSDWETMFNINVLGLMRVTQAAVSSMRVKGSTEGHIINICSLAGHEVTNRPHRHVYHATKFAVTAITTGLRYELLALQPEFLCRVSQISPGLVDTPMVTGNYPFKILEDTEIAETVIYQLSLPPHAQVQDVLIRPTAQEM